MIFLRYKFIVYFLENIETNNEASLLDRIKMTETLESTATNQE